LRAAEDRVADPVVREAALSSLSRVAPQGASFELRFLSLGPASLLAEAGEARAASVLEAALADPDAHLRARAALLSGSIPSLRPKLEAIVADPDPRVRQAIALALTKNDDPPARVALLALISDEWSFVRAASYDALAAAQPDPAVDTALVKRLADDRSEVALPRLLGALSHRHVVSAGPALRRLSENEKRSIDVRARAVQALGGVCATDSLDYLTKLAQDGSSATALADQQSLAGAAIVALGRLHPADLASRLGPIRGEGVAPAAVEAAKSALEETDVCR
jgi:HEAT repeat protein